MGECVSNFGDYNLICSCPHVLGWRREEIAELRTMIAGEDEMTCCLNLLLIMALKHTLLLRALLSLSRDLAEKTDGFLI